MDQQVAIYGLRHREIPLRRSTSKRERLAHRSVSVGATRLSERPVTQKQAARRRLHEVYRSVRLSLDKAGRQTPTFVQTTLADLQRKAVGSRSSKQRKFTSRWLTASDWLKQIKTRAFTARVFLCAGLCVFVAIRYGFMLQAPTLH